MSNIASASTLAHGAAASAGKTVVVVEDEAAIADTLVYSLQTEGFAVQWLQTGQALVAQHAQADLVILDVGLPDGSGFEFCKQLRKHSEVPVMFLTARSDEIDRVVGLEIGADDYVTKPFSPREVVARVKAILKRYSTPVAATAETWQAIADFELNERQCGIRCCQQPLNLTALEFKLLRHFLVHAKQTLSREQLLTAVGVAADVGYDRNIDSHIKALRAKLRQVSGKDYLVTQRGFGYALHPAGSPV